MNRKHTFPQPYSQINSLAKKCHYLLRNLDTSDFMFENNIAAEMSLIALECCQILENPSTREMENTCMHSLANLIRHISIYEDDTITDACYKIAKFVIRKYSTSIILDECTPYVLSELALGFSKFCEDEFNPKGLMLKATEVIAELVNVEYEQDDLQSLAFHSSFLLVTSFTKWLEQTQGRSPIKTSVSYIADRLIKMNNVLERSGKELSILVKSFSAWYTHDRRMGNLREVVLYFAQNFLVQYETDNMRKYHPLSISCICNHLIPFYKDNGNETFRKVVLAAAKRIGTYTPKSSLDKLEPSILCSMAFNFSKWLKSDDGDTTIRLVVINILDSVNTQYRTGKSLDKFSAEALLHLSVAINKLLEEGEINEVIWQTAFVLANILIQRFENNEITHYKLSALSYLVKSLSYWNEDPDLEFRNIILLAILALAKSFSSKYFRDENAPHFIDFNYTNLADGFGSWCKYDDDVQTLRGAMEIIGFLIHKSYIENEFYFSCEKDICLLVMAFSKWCGDDQYIRRAASLLAYIISGSFFYEIETFTPSNLSNLALAFSKWIDNDKKKTFQQAIQAIARTVTEHRRNKLENYDTSDLINLITAFLKFHGRDDEEGSLRKATLDIARTVTSHLKTKKKLERYLPAYLQILAHCFRKWNNHNTGSDSDSDTVSSEGHSSDNGVHEEQTFKDAVLAIASVVRNDFHENCLRDYSLFEVCILSKAFAKWHQESEMLDTIILIARYILIHNQGTVKVCSSQCLSYLLKALSAWYYKDDPEEYIKTAVESIALIVISRLIEENSSQVCSANELAAFALHFSKWHEKDAENIILMSIGAIAKKINDLSKTNKLADFRAKDLANISRALGFWPDEPALQKCVMVIAHKVQNSKFKIDTCKSRYLIYFTTGLSKYLMDRFELISLKILARAIAVAINAHRPEDFKVYDIPYLNYLNETFSKFSEQIFEKAVQAIKKAIDLNKLERNPKETIKHKSETPCN